MSLQNDNNSVFTVKQSVSSFLNRPRRNQPRGYSNFSSNKPKSYVCKNHTYEYYDCDWEYEGTFYRKGYYDENGEYYDNLALKNSDGSYDVYLRCDFCGNQSMKKYGKDQVPLCEVCGTRFNVFDMPNDECVINVDKINPSKREIAKILKIFFGIYFGIFAFLLIIIGAGIFFIKDAEFNDFAPEYSYDDNSDYISDEEYNDYLESTNSYNHEIDSYDWLAFGSNSWHKKNDETSTLSTYIEDDTYFIRVDGLTYKILDMHNDGMIVELNGDTLTFPYRIYTHGILRFNSSEYVYDGAEDEILPHEVRAINSNYDVITSKSDAEIIDVYSRYNDDDAVYVLRSNNVIRMYQLSIPEDYEYDVMENIDYVTHDVFSEQMDNAIQNRDVELSGICDYEPDSITIIVTIRDLDKYSSSDLVDSAIDGELEAIAYAWLSGIGYLED